MSALRLTWSQLSPLIPAQAGTSRGWVRSKRNEIPACAGMSGVGCYPLTPTTPLNADGKNADRLCFPTGGPAP